MKKTMLLFIILAPFTVAMAQSKVDKFNALLKVYDTTKLVNYINDWEKSNSKDPALYLEAIKFYFSWSTKEYISMQISAHNQIPNILFDIEAKSINTANKNIDYTEEKLNKALSYTNKGINKFPNRLDFRLSNCFLHYQFKNNDSITADLISTLEYSKIIKNKWLWIDNKPIKGVDQFIMKIVYPYMKKMAELENETLYPNITQMGEVALNYYLNDLQILTLTATTYILMQKYDPAEKYLLIAEKLKPTDFVIIYNLANCYRLKGDKQKAIKYYELSKVYGDKTTIEKANYFLKELKKK